MKIDMIITYISRMSLQGECRGGVNSKGPNGLKLNIELNIRHRRGVECNTFNMNSILGIEFT